MSDMILDELKQVNKNLEYLIKLNESMVDLFQSKKKPEMPEQVKEMITNVRKNLERNPSFAKNPENLKLFDSLIKI